MTTTTDYIAAVQAATDAADIYARCHGRTMWNADDCALAKQELERLLARTNNSLDNLTYHRYGN